MNSLTLKQKIIDELYIRFKPHSVPKKVIADIIELGIVAGLSLEQAAVGTRMSISKRYNFMEYFNIQDVMTATGETEVEVMKRRKEIEAELIANGENPLKYFPQVIFASGLH